MKFFKKIQFDDDKTSRFQDNVEAALDQLTRLPILDGVFIEDVSLVTGSINYIAHKLGRKPRMWIISRKNSNADIWETYNSTTNGLLALNSSSNVKISLWVA